MAFGVIAIHFEANYQDGFHFPFLINWGIHLAVPFYFITSGYLLQRKLEITDDNISGPTYIMNKVVKLFRIWLCWMVISLPLAFYFYRSYDNEIFLAIKSYLFNATIRGCGPRSAPLWFIYSMAWTFFIIAIVSRFRYFKTILTILFFIISFIYWHASISDNLLEERFKFFTERILGGGIYILSGMITYQFKKYIGYSVPFICIVLSILLFYFKLPYDKLLGGIGFFLIALNITLESSPFLLNLRNQSMWIYYLHEYILFLFFIIIGIKNLFPNPWLILLMVFFVSALFAFTINRIQNITESKILRFLIS